MRTKFASVDIGDGGTPGESAEVIKVELFQISEGRYEAVGKHSTGSNQGDYEEHYVHGPWRGRGPTFEDAVAAMLGIVETEYHHCISRASQEALYEAEDKIDAVE